MKSILKVIKELGAMLIAAGLFVLGWVLMRSSGKSVDNANEENIIAIIILVFVGVVLFIVGKRLWEK